LRRDAILGAVTAVLCVALFFETSKVRNFDFAAVGADVWPKITIGLILLLSVVQILLGLRQTRAEPQEPEAGAGLLERSFVPLAVFSAVILFALAVPYFGFAISGVLMVFGLLTTIGPKTGKAILGNAAISLVAVLAMTFIFTQVMGILLPQWRL